MQARVFVKAIEHHIVLEMSSTGHKDLPAEVNMKCKGVTFVLFSICDQSLVVRSDACKLQALVCVQGYWQSKGK